MSAKRVLLISHDPVGEQMAGLGIRAFELGRVLTQHADVTIAHGGTTSGSFRGIETVGFSPHDPRPLRPLIGAADTVICHPVWPTLSSWLRRSSARVIHDLYDPETLETLELFADSPARARRMLGHTTQDRLHDALRTGHHFVCASEKQRDLWLGAMLALRLIDPLAYSADPSFRSVIDVVPFGVPADSPTVPLTAEGPRERFLEIGDDSELVLWNGGIWSWLDADTAVRAVASLAERRPQVRLVFMGAAEQEAAVRATEGAKAVAQELGALGRSVLFNDEWVAYDDRVAWLAEANCALSTHPEHLETRFAFRTRLLDCFWAGLPVVCTEGDDLSDRVEREGLGATAPAGDHLAVAAAIEQVLDRGRASYADALSSAAETLAWPRIAQPLVRWIDGPEPAGRPGDAHGALRPSFGHRARSLVYRAGGSHMLALRARRAR